MRSDHARISLGAICLTGRFLGALAGVSALIFAAPIRPPQMTCRDFAPIAAYSPLGIDTGNGRTILQVRQNAFACAKRNGTTVVWKYHHRLGGN
jgi:hypothetical protein